MDEGRDYLDGLSDAIAQDDPREVQRWAMTKLVAQLVKARNDRGYTQAEVADRMGLSERRLAELEQRPWSASFTRVLAYACALGVEVGIVAETRVAA